MSAALTAISAVSKIANLADQDDVWVLSQEGPQRRGEVQPDVLAHLHLVDPGHVNSTGSSAVRMLVVGVLIFEMAE